MKFGDGIAVRGTIKIHFHRCDFLLGAVTGQVCLQSRLRCILSKVRKQPESSIPKGMPEPWSLRSRGEFLRKSCRAAPKPEIALFLCGTWDFGGLRNLVLRNLVLRSASPGTWCSGISWPLWIARYPASLVDSCKVWFFGCAEPPKVNVSV